MFYKTEILTFGEMGSSPVAPNDQCCYCGDVFPQMHLDRRAGCGASEEHLQQTHVRPRNW